MKSPSAPMRAPLPGKMAPAKWPRGLIAGAVGLTLLQAAIFAWLARIPEPLRGFIPISPTNAAARSNPAMVSLLAYDGLRDAQSWLPNPRPFLTSRTSPNASAALRAPARWEVAAAPAARLPQFLPLSAAPPPISPAIPRPEARPPEFKAPPPEAPATAPLALNSLQITVGGTLKERGLAEPLSLVPWAGNESLGVSRVDLSVNADGEVVLARLVESCGVKAADLQFLTACRAARFVPLGPARPGLEFSKLIRGYIQVRWPAPPSP